MSVHWAASVSLRLSCVMVYGIVLMVLMKTGALSARCRLLLVCVISHLACCIQHSMAWHIEKYGRL